MKTAHSGPAGHSGPRRFGGQIRSGYLCPEPKQLPHDVRALAHDAFVELRELRESSRLLQPHNTQQIEFAYVTKSEATDSGSGCHCQPHREILVQVYCTYSKKGYVRAKKVRTKLSKEVQKLLFRFACASHSCTK